MLSYLDKDYLQCLHKVYLHTVYLHKDYFQCLWTCLIWVLQPFQEYLAYSEPIVHQRLAKKLENPGKNHLTIRKQSLVFPHVTGARLEPQQLET